jgi:hypothetical protein
MASRFFHQTRIMIKNAFLLSALFVEISIVGCNKADEDLPSCIQDEIDGREKIGEIHLSSVQKYELNSKEVYVVNYEGGADFQSPVLDDQCNTVCALGGIAGNDECDGVKFSEEAKLIETVWED